jgi:large subunit ribosomal protein L23
VAVSGVILQPVVSEKSFTKADNGVYTFRVDPKANKKQIKDEVEKRFKVTVEDVNVLRLPGKLVHDWRKGITGRRKSYKKAVVKVKAGDTIDIFT